MKKNVFQIFLTVSLLVLASLACRATGESAPAPTEAASQTPQAAQTAAPQPTATPKPTQPPAQQPEAAAQGTSMACVGTKDQGVVCLDENGWKVYNKSNSQLTNNFISAAAACPDGRVAFAHFNGISLFDGKEWNNYNKGDYSTVSALACGENGVLWVAHFEGVSRYDGQWTKFSADLLASESKLVYDVAIAPNGIVWVSTPNSVASFDGNNWTVYREGQGFEKKLFFKSLAFDNQGRTIVSHGNGIAIFEDGKWSISNSPDFLSSVEDMTVDTSGRIWLGTLINGIYAIENGSWSNQTFKNSGLSSNDVNALAADASGRVWAATEYGLSVFADNAWTAFRMDNSGLPVNDIRGVVVIGNGPTLPAAIEKPTGSLTGTVKNKDGSPVANADVEICVQVLGTSFFGATPCSDQPFFLTSKTDSNGKFIFENVPTGYYTIVMKIGDGWAQLTGNMGGVSEQVLVQPGETADVGDITMRE